MELQPWRLVCLCTRRSRQDFSTDSWHQKLAGPPRSIGAANEKAINYCQRDGRWIAVGDGGARGPVQSNRPCYRRRAHRRGQWSCNRRDRRRRAWCGHRCDGRRGFGRRSRCRHNTLAATSPLSPPHCRPSGLLSRRALGANSQRKGRKSRINRYKPGAGAHCLSGDLDARFRVGVGGSTGAGCHCSRAG